MKAGQAWSGGYARLMQASNWCNIHHVAYAALPAQLRAPSTAA